MTVLCKICFQAAPIAADIGNSLLWCSRLTHAAKPQHNRIQYGRMFPYQAFQNDEAPDRREATPCCWAIWPWHRHPNLAQQGATMKQFEHTSPKIDKRFLNDSLILSTYVRELALGKQAASQGCGSLFHVGKNMTFSSKLATQTLNPNVPSSQSHCISSHEALEVWRNPTQVHVRRGRFEEA